MADPTPSSHNAAAQGDASSSQAPQVQQGGEGAGVDDGVPKRDPRYPLTVAYCTVCSLPAELHEYHSNNQFEKCKDWLRHHAPHHFPTLFPDECAARLAALTLSQQTSSTATTPSTTDPPLPTSAADGILPADADIPPDADGPAKVAVPIEQKTSGGKKKKTPAEVVLTLGKRKGWKHVTVVYGLDLFGIKLKDATKAAKRKFATGSSLTMSADNREVIEIQGSRQEDMAQLVHSEWGVPKDSIFIVNAQKKKVKAFP